MSENNMPSALRQLLGAGNTEGWPGLSEEATKEANAEMALETFERARVIAAPFMSSAGRESLRALERLTVEQSTLSQSFDNLDFWHATASMLVREGQNSLVRHIKACIAQAEQGPPKPE